MKQDKVPEQPGTDAVENEPRHHRKKGHNKNMTTTAPAEGLLHVGLGVVHDTHGEGVIAGFETRPHPGTDKIIEMVKVEFPLSTLTWSQVMPRDDGSYVHEPSELTILVPVDLILTGDSWHPVPEVTDEDRERVYEQIRTRRTHIPSGASASDRKELVQEAASVGAHDPERMIDSLIRLVDWSLATSNRQDQTASPTRAVERLDQKVAHLGTSLWFDDVLTRTSRGIREVIHDQLLAAAVFLKRGSTVEDIQASARELASTIESRVELLHGDTIRKNATEARAKKERGLPTKKETA